MSYGGFSVGGTSSSYQLHGPYVIEKTHEEFRLVFDVVVVAASYSALQNLSDRLEESFSKRLEHGEELSINIGGSSWRYAQGTTLLNATARVVKTANPDTDRGFSRAYTVSIGGELPALTKAGLRNVEVVVQSTPSRQRIVTMRGVYTATESTTAVESYQDEFDDEASVYLTAIDDDATWELVDESFSMDRNVTAGEPVSNTCEFSRQYVELLLEQSQNTLDDDDIRDHRVVFTDLSQHPGDNAEEIYRLRRVIATYDCAISPEVPSTTPREIYEEKVKPHIAALFQNNYNPQVFCVEDQRVSFDETSRRMSVSTQFLYQTEESEGLVEVSQSLTFRELRTLDYTPSHEPLELAAAVDVGFATVERIWNRTAIVVGDDAPKLRISRGPIKGPAGLFDAEIGAAGDKGPDATGAFREITKFGWNIIANTSQITDQWVGDPSSGEQIKLSILTETVVERFNIELGARTAVPIQRGPIT